MLIIELIFVTQIGFPPRQPLLGEPLLAYLLFNAFCGLVIFRDNNDNNDNNDSVAYAEKRRNNKPKKKSKKSKKKP